MRASIGVLSGILIFGVLGDKRMVASGYSDSGAFYDIGRATDGFKELRVPSGFFWVYMYAVSPLANFSNQDRVDNKNKGNIIDLIGYTIAPDFVQKRIYGDEFRGGFLQTCQSRN